MWNRIKGWWAAEGALVGLQGMSDRMLQDMGLQREELRDQVLGRETEDPAPRQASLCVPKAARSAR